MAPEVPDVSEITSPIFNCSNCLMGVKVSIRVIKVNVATHGTFLIGLSSQDLHFTIMCSNK